MWGRDTRLLGKWVAEAVTTAADAAGVKLDAGNSANLTAAATGRDGDERRERLRFP